MQQVPHLSTPFSWCCWFWLRSCQQYSSGSRYLGRAESWLGGSSLSWLWNQSCCSLWSYRSGCFLTRTFQFESPGSLWCAWQCAGWPTHSHRFCADRPAILSFRQLIRVSVCSLFSTAWKDILILYAYRKRGKLSEHLLFINLASYCSKKVINGKTEAQSN